MYYEIVLETPNEITTIDSAYEEYEAVDLLEEYKQFHLAKNLRIEVYKSDSLEELEKNEPVKVIPGRKCTH